MGEGKKEPSNGRLGPSVIDINGAVPLLSRQGQAQEVRNKQSSKSHPFPSERAVCFRCSRGKQSR